VHDGECLVLLGPSGAGKTLLLEAVLGIARLDAGSVRSDGQDITRAPLERRGFAYVPQDLALFAHLGVFAQIAFGLRSQRLGRDMIERRVREVSAQVGITHLLDRPSVLDLSGGEKQRVALARAIAVSPRVLFLDEPFCALDSFVRDELYQMFGELRRATRLTTFLVTHNRDEALLLGDRVALMRQGAIVQTGTAADVLSPSSSPRASRSCGSL
jgi:ABC-type Fe3+/spermidine/putrescine transport system ATPase subunit